MSKFLNQEIATIRKAKYRVKNAEGQYEVVYLETSADQVEVDATRQFVTEAEKVQFNENTIFNTDMLTVNGIGGIGAGEDLNNLPVQDLLTKLLFPYVAPTVSATSNPNGGTFETGTPKTVTSIAVNVGKKSEKITKVEVFDGSTSLGVKEGAEVANGGNFAFTVDVPVSTNKSFSAKVTDAKNKSYTANTGGFNFVYPYYMGVCANDATIDEALIEALTKKVEGKGNKNHTFTCNFQRMIFAYPKSHGALRQIMDPNNFDVTGTFGRQEVSITGLDGKAVDYYVYVNSASTVSNFAMRFNY